LLGPNGAGKTTLLKTICGLVLPEKGRLEVFGVPSDSPSLSGVIGLAHGDERSFYWRLSARENLEFFARLHGLRGSRLKVSVKDLLARVDLIGDADRRFGDFSSGMKQRLGIARALLADPEVVLMDEPTRSLDPVSSQRLREWIAEKLHGEEKKTILLATHNLREAEELCGRVAVIARGRLRVVATPLELRRRGMSGPRYRFVLEGEEQVDRLEHAEIEMSSPLDGRVEVLLRLESDTALDPLLAEIQRKGCRVISIAAEEPDLETVFHELIGSDDGGDTSEAES